jgi:hypothetical protein
LTKYPPAGILFYIPQEAIMKVMKKHCINGHEIHISRKKCPECGTTEFEKAYNICDNCNEKFTVRQEIAGELMLGYNRKYCYTCSPPRSDKKYDLMFPEPVEKVCSTCKESKPLSEYRKERISVTGRQLYSSCCKKCKSDYSIWYTRKCKQDMVDYKGGVCERCGYDDCLTALDFHHLDPTEKDFSLKERTARKVTDEVKRELDKCILVCATCHREIHEEINNQDRDLSRFDKE